MLWGIKPEWKKDLIIIKARNETIIEKQIFRRPKGVFIEYIECGEKGKKSQIISWLKNQLIFFAGLYNDSGCCIVTEKSI